MAIRNAAEILEIAKDLPDVTPVIIDADEPTEKYGGDSFVALHGDGSANTSRRAGSVGYRNDEGRVLSARWKTLYEAGGWPFGFLDDNYTNNLRFYYGTGRAISAGNERAAIVEFGFMTNPDSRAFIESEKGVKLAAASVLAAVYPHLSLDRLLAQAPEPPVVEDTHPPQSTEPSAVIVTLGDTGAEVLAWQRDLVKLLPRSAHAHRPDGHFGPKTVGWTNEAFRVLKLTARDAVRPLVGPRSRAAMDKELVRRAAKPAQPSWQGKALVSKINGLRFYAQPGWAPQVRPAGTFDRGHRFPRIESRISVGAGHQYRVRNSKGHGPFYVTASPTYVELR
jgi:hypothetical protein